MKKQLFSILFLSLVISSSIFAVLPIPFTGAAYNEYVQYVYNHNRRKYDDQEKKLVQVIKEEIFSKLSFPDSYKNNEELIRHNCRNLLCGEKLFCHVVSKKPYLKNFIDKNYQLLCQSYPMNEFYFKNLKSFFSLNYYKILAVLFTYGDSENERDNFVRILYSDIANAAQS